MKWEPARSELTTISYSASRALHPPTEPGCSRVRQYMLVDIGNIRCRLRGRVGSEHTASCRGGEIQLHPHPARVVDTRRPPPSRGGWGHAARSTRIDQTRIGPTFPRGTSQPD